MQTRITREQVEEAFKRDNLQIDERFSECGFLYFKGGRIFWSVDKHKYDDPEDETIDRACGVCRDAISISPSWGFPQDALLKRIMGALKLYVLYARQQRQEASAPET